MKIGFIGTGVMGNPMAQHLFKKFKSLKVFNVPAERMQNLIDLGCEPMKPSEMAKQCNFIVTMVNKPSDVEKILLDPLQGVLANARPGTMVIDHTTSCPELAKRVAKEALARGMTALDAPVTGADVGAKEGKLVVMAGGRKEDFKTAKPIFDAYSIDARLVGPSGSGQSAKAANQISIAACLFGLCETILFAEKAGLDTEVLIDLLRQGSGGSFSMDKYGHRIISGDFRPGVSVENFIKDLEIAIAECHRMNIVLPGLTTSHMLLNIYRAEISDEKGAHGVIQALRQMNKKSELAK